MQVFGMTKIAEVVNLQTVEYLDRQSAVETLEAVLEEALQGKVSAVAIAIVRPNGAANTCSSSASKGVNLLGAISLLHLRVAQSIEDET